MVAAFITGQDGVEGVGEGERSGKHSVRFACTQKQNAWELSVERLGPGAGNLTVQLWLFPWDGYCVANRGSFIKLRKNNEMFSQ